MSNKWVDSKLFLGPLLVQGYYTRCGVTKMKSGGLCLQELTDRYGRYFVNRNTSQVTLYAIERYSHLWLWRPGKTTLSRGEIIQIGTLKSNYHVPMSLEI